MPDSTLTQTVTIPQTVDPMLVFGPSDEILRTIMQALPQLDLMARGDQVKLSGPAREVALVAGLFDELIDLTQEGNPLSAQAVAHALELLIRQQDVNDTTAQAAVKGAAAHHTAGKVQAKSPGQALYLEAMTNNTIVFGIGPAGTGKTYLAMARAVEELLTGKVKRIILTRPAVEAGENLGFLPGSLTDKINPYLRPLYDALHDLLDAEVVAKLMAAGTIEVAPLAYMRGRTLNDAFVVLDEAQNTTPQQMKMFLTRLGFNARIVVTGDISQVDLPRGVQSGLRVVQRILDGIEDIKFCRLTSEDVVRHQLVGRIIDAYDRYDAANPTLPEANHHRRQVRED